MTTFSYLDFFKKDIVYKNFFDYYVFHTNFKLELSAKLQKVY